MGLYSRAGSGKCTTSVTYSVLDAWSVRWVRVQKEALLR